MSWLIVAKMPLLISSRMTSAGLTDSSSASSLTVMVPGSSIAPRSRGSSDLDLPAANAPSRRGGLRGPRRPRVPLLLLATGSSFESCRSCGGPAAERSRGTRPGAGSRAPVEGALGDGVVRQSVSAADIGAAAGQPAGRVERRRVRPASGRSACSSRFGRDRPAGDAGPSRDAPRRGPARDGPRGYDATSSVAARLGGVFFGGRRRRRPWRRRGAVLAAASARRLAGCPARGFGFGGRGLARLGASVAASRRLRLGRTRASAVGAVASVVAGFAVSASASPRRAAFAFAPAAAVGVVGLERASAACLGGGRAVGGRLGAGSASSARRAALASATDTSLRMSIRQPVRRAASRAFWPSRPIASESIRSGTVTLAIRCSSSMSTREDLGRAEGVGHEDAGVVAPRDDVDLLAGQLGDDRLDARAALADGRADRVEPVLARGDRDLRAAAGLAGDRLDLDRAAVDLGDLELEQALEEALVGPADEDLRAARSSAGPRARTP